MDLVHLIILLFRNICDFEGNVFLVLNIKLLGFNSVFMCRLKCTQFPFVFSELSLGGEKLVDEEVRRALYGVKQMKEVMWRNEQKHEHLMRSLRNSSEKKKVGSTFDFLQKKIKDSSR